MVYEIQARAERAQRRWRTIAFVLGVIAVIAVTVAATLVLTSRDEKPQSQTRTKTSTPSAEPAEESTGEAEKELPGLLDVAWVPWHGTALPVSSKHGPLEMDGDLARGFTHDTPGAVLAAIHIAYRSGHYPGPKVYRPTVEQQVVGEDKAAMLSHIESLYEAARLKSGRPPGSPIPQTPVDVKGWRVETPSADSIPVHLLLSQVADDGREVCVDVRIEMVWRDGDWKVVAPANGDARSVSTQVACLGGDYEVIPRQG